MHYQALTLLALCATAIATPQPAGHSEAQISKRQTVTWTSKGCYVDNPSRRFLKGDSFNSQSMTVELCQNFCASEGYSQCGVEYGTECYCGYGGDGSQPAQASDCNMACAGDATEKCGGPARMNFYVNSNTPSVNPGHDGWSYQGCYTDDVSARTLTPGVAAAPAGGMTVDYCTSACQSLGFAYAGLEYRNECFCANSIGGNGVAVTGSDCNMACKGNLKEWCGGSNRLTLYKYASS